METLVEGIQWIIDFFNTGIYEFAKDLLEELVAWLVIAKIEFQIWAIQFSWDVAKTVLVNVGISAMVEQAWSSVDSSLMGYLTFFRLPDAFNVVFQAYTTKVVLRVMGW